MSAQRPVVWLLRSGEEPDPYEEVLTDAGLDARSVPVLTFEKVNQAELRNALEHPRSYDGLIFTSPRAVEALADAMPWLPSENVLWHAKAIFAVGPRTADELRTIGFDPEGEESGSAEMLAAYVTERRFGKPLLFLCGDKRRDQLPDKLRMSGVAFEELCVYESRPRENIETRGLPDPDWIVIFSPSGLDAVRSSGTIDVAQTRIAAIGPTTAAALEQAGVGIDAVASEPSADGVASAILAAGGR